MKKTKKIMDVILFCVLVCAPLIVFAMLMSTHAKQEIAKREAIENPPKPKYKLLPYKVAKPIAEIGIDLKEQYKICPPLRPDRFRRRVKMLWGIDVNDYPDNSNILITSVYLRDYLSTKYQLITDGSSHDSTEIYVATEKDDPLDRDMPMPTYADNIYSIYRRYLYMNNPKDLEYLHEYCYNIYQQTGKANPHMSEFEVFVYTTYLPYIAYRSALFNVSADLLKDIDEMNRQVKYAYLLCSQDFGTDDFDFTRITDLRLDVLSQYLKKQKNNGYNIIIGSKGNPQWNTPPKDLIITDRFEVYFAHNIIYQLSKYSENFIWNNYTAAKGVAAFLSFILQLEDKNLNKEVLDFMKFENNQNEQFNHIKKDIRENNYYGYTLLREYDNNLMREMPTLAKIGTSFQGHVKQGNSLLLLEPFKESYSIDTLQTYETFTAYEMGHDDYYFVEVEKPVESPIAGTDGYAKIVDRTEIVHGYIEKAKVVPYTDAQLLAHPKFTDHTTSKRGVINDKDGYVNMRAERSTKAEVVEKIVTLGEFEYWQLVGNWYIVEKANGKRGFVYKDRIKEKL